MSSTAKTPIPSAAVITKTLGDPVAGEPSINAPVALFGSDYDKNNGDLLSLSPSGGAFALSGDDDPASILTGKRNYQPSSPSPRRVRHDNTKSPQKSAFAPPAAVVTQLSQPPSGVANPPAIRRDGPSPTSVMEVVVDTTPDPLPTAKATPKSTLSMIGHVPKTQFLWFCRKDYFSKTTKYTAKQIKDGITTVRTKVLWHFTRTSNVDTRGELPANTIEGENGVTTRSSVEDVDDWIVDMDAADMKTTDTRRLSLYCFEQLLICDERTKLLVLVKQSMADKLLGEGLAEAIEEVQGTEPVLLSGEYYHRLKCTIVDASKHKDVRGEGAGRYSMAAFQSDYEKRIGEFKVEWDGFGRGHRFNWKNVVENSNSMRFFGAPMSFSRSFDTLFHRVTNESTLYHRFISFYNEFEGDVVSCLALYNAYTNRPMAVLEEKLGKAEKKAKKFNKNLFKSSPVVKFVVKFDDHCRKHLGSVFTEFKDHSATVVSVPDMKSFIDEAPSVFGDYWYHLCELRGVKPNQKAEKNRNIPRIHSVFFEVLAMVRIANRRRLMHWALIQNVTNLARGVGRKAEMATSYFGFTVSNSTRRRMVARLTGNAKEGRANNDTLKHKHCKLLRTATALIITYDNYQRGLTLQHQRGEHSSAYFKGTHQCAHQVITFEDDTFDAYYVPFTQHEQAIPSPWGMPMLEAIDTTTTANLTSYILNYPEQDCTFISTPDFTGRRVDKYIELRDIMNHLMLMERAFPTTSTDDESEYFEQCPATFNQNTLQSFARQCRTKKTQLLFKRASSFQRASVSKWNPTSDESTLSIYLGLLAIDEAASKECGAITLDLLLRAGVLEQSNDGGWNLAEDYKTRRVYLYGDAKTVENVTKFVRDMQDRRITYSVANLQSEIFLEALTVVKQLPGDWHTGLNMLTSIYNMYYVGFLDQFQELLGWKRVTKDVRSCYYQAARLVTFVYDELTRYFAHQFVSQRPSKPDDSTLTEEEYVTRVTTEWMVFLRSLKGSKDKWIATCGCFLEMAYDFLQFVKAYRLGDAVSIEYGYQKHSPVWEFLGQNKYVDIFFSQNETLYRDSPFSVLQELRMNRVVRRYIDKRCVAQDEFLENGNRFFSEFPLPRTLAGFEEQSNYVGLGLMCKHFSDQWYTTKWEEDFEASYTRSVAPTMTPEKKMIYEVFRLLKTHVEDEGRVAFGKTFVTSVESEINVELRRDKLEKQMHDGPASSADDLLKTLNQVYEESIRQLGIDVGDEDEEEGELAADEAAEYEEKESAAPTQQSKSREKVSKKQMHVGMLKDPWVLGRKSFAKKDVVAIRKEAVVRLARKSKLRKAILNNMRLEDGQTREVVMREAVEEMPAWQAYTRQGQNNLNLV